MIHAASNASMDLACLVTQGGGRAAWEWAGRPKVADGPYFGAYKAPIDSPERREELLRKIKAIDGIRWKRSAPLTAEKYQGMLLAPFSAPGPRGQLIKVLDWLVSETRRAGSAPPSSDTPGWMGRSRPVSVARERSGR
jgi:hypothetical protein